MLTMTPVGFSGLPKQRAAVGNRKILSAVAPADRFSVRFGLTTGKIDATIFPDKVPADFDMSSFTGGKQTLIGGKLEQWTGETRDVSSVVMLRQPDGTLAAQNIAPLAWMKKEQALAALDAAKKAWDGGQGEWAVKPLEQRIETMKNFIPEMKKQRDTVAKLLMLEIGKNPDDAYKEFDRTVEYIERTLVHAKQIADNEKVLQKTGKDLNKQSLQPIGPTLCMGPSNYPLNETFTLLIPALLMGNPVVCKLAKSGTLAVTALYEAFAKSFPQGTINFISGDGAELITPIMQSGDIDCFSFIGGEPAAEAIVKNHPHPNRLAKVLGLGAKNLGVVLPGENITDKMIKEVLSGAISFNGQRCTALKILAVHRSQADEFVKKLSAALDAKKRGMPYEKGAEVTPVPMSNIQGKWGYKAMYDDAIAKGAKVMNQDGGNIVGNFFNPAVLYPVTKDMTLYRSEQFGPLIPVMVYDDLQEVVDYAKTAEVGQQAAIFGYNAVNVQKMVTAFKNLSCRTTLNSQCKRGDDDLPFVGRKSSGSGVLSIKEALYRFTQPNVVSADDTPEDRALLSQITI